MTRKDYVAIAAALKTAGNEYWNADLLLLFAGTCERIADVMAQDNPRFDRARFLQACGVQS